MNELTNAYKIKGYGKVAEFNKMKLKFTTLLEITLGISLCGGGVFLGAKQNVKEATPVSASSSSYWATVNSNANADTLFNKLHALINTNTVNLGYGGLWDAYEETDQSPAMSPIRSFHEEWPPTLADFLAEDFKKSVTYHIIFGLFKIIP